MKTRKAYFLTTGILLLVLMLALPASGLAQVKDPPPVKIFLPLVSSENTQKAISGEGSEYNQHQALTLVDAACTLNGVTRACELWALPGSLTMPDGRVVPVWGFADNPAGPAQVPGPVIRANPGETLEIVLHNELPGEMVSLGFPAIENVIPDIDGVPSGGTASYVINLASPGAYLYEAGLTSGGARQVAMGMFGPLVVSDPAPAWQQEVLLVFSEIDPDFNVAPGIFDMVKFRPQYWLINGQAFPDTGNIAVTGGQTVLMQYLNAGVVHHSIGLLGLSQEIFSLDGEAFHYSYSAVAETLAPGGILESLLRIPVDATDGTLYPLYDASLIQHNNNQRLADFRQAFGGMLTFLQVGPGVPVDPGPLVSAVTVNPSLTNGSVDVLLTATADETTTGGSTIAAAQYRIDGGAWMLMAVDPPAATIANLSATILAADVAALGDGGHTVEVQAQDDLGNWGAPAAVILTLDLVGPTVSAVTLVPDTTDGSVDVALSATADETTSGGGTIAAAQYRLDGGGWLPMTVLPLAPSIAELSATIPAATVAGLADGPHTVEVQAQDDLGNWGASTSATLTLVRAGPVVSAVVLDPSRTVGAVDVLLTANADETTTGGNIIAAAEYRIDAGVWQSMIVDPPGATIANLSATIPAATVAGLLEGPHSVEVHAQDDLGSWGSPAAATLTLDLTGPQVSAVTFNPDPSNGSVDLTLTASADETTTGGGTILAAEYSLDAGATWQLMTVDPPTATVANLSATIPAAVVAGLGDGLHIAQVVALDDLGNLGTPVTATFQVDMVGPNVNTVFADPNPTDGVTPVALTATADDAGTGGSTIVAAEWFVDTDPGVGNGTPMAATDGVFDSITETLSASVDASAWMDGSYSLYVRAQDAAGNWGPSGSVLLVKLGLSNVLFADSFESGDFAAWSIEVDAEGDMNVTAAAVMVGALGMEVLIDNNTAMYLVDLTPAAETEYHARFYFDPNTISMSANNSHELLIIGSNTTSFARIQFRYLAGNYQIRGGIRTDAGGYFNTAWYTINDAPNAIEIGWTASTAPGANNGTLSLYLNGNLMQAIGSVDNDTRAVERIGLGAVVGIDTGTRGTYFFDDFVSTRDTVIGP